MASVAKFRARPLGDKLSRPVFAVTLIAEGIILQSSGLDFRELMTIVAEQGLTIG